MPSGGNPDIGAIVDGFTNGCAKGLSGDSIHGPPDVSGVNPSDMGAGAGKVASGCSGAGANAGPANEDEPSSHGSSNDGGTAFPVPASSGERVEADSVKLCAKTGCAKTSAEAATRVAIRRARFAGDFVFMVLSAPSIPKIRIRNLRRGWESSVLTA